MQATGPFSTYLPIALGTSGGGATLDTNAYTVKLSATLSGSGGLNMVGSGTLTLAAADTYTGTTLVSGGTLGLSNALALQNSTLDTNGSGMLSFGSLPAATLGGLTGPGTLNLANSASIAVALSVGNNKASTTYSGMLDGPGSLTKIGTGVLALTGSSTYTGPTSINQGALIVNGSLVSPVTVNSGGTLGGMGNLGSGTVNAGGQIAPGSPLGTMHFSGGLVLAAGAQLDYDLDLPGTSSMISCGNLVLGSPLQFSSFDFTTTTNFQQGTYYLIEANSLPGGSLGTSASGAIGDYLATLAVQNNNLVLTVVPEPGTLVLLGVAATILLAWRCRQERAAAPGRLDANLLPRGER